MPCSPQPSPGQPWLAAREESQGKLDRRRHRRRRSVAWIAHDSGSRSTSRTLSKKASGEHAHGRKKDWRSPQTGGSRGRSAGWSVSHQFPGLFLSPCWILPRRLAATPTLTKCGKLETHSQVVKTRHSVYRARTSPKKAKTDSAFNRCLPDWPPHASTSDCHSVWKDWLVFTPPKRESPLINKPPLRAEVSKTTTSF